VTNKKARQINGTEFIVKAIDGKKLTVVDENGNQETVDGSMPLGLDYANVSTAYSAQGLTAQRVIVAATNSPTSAQEPFYVKISRQTKDIKVYVEDLEKLHEWVEKSVAQDNPLELIGEHYDNQQRSFIGSDRLFDTECERITSPEHDSHEGEQNQETYMRKQMDTIPLTVKQMLDAFIAQFKEALEENKSDQMSESIQALVEAMNKLSTKLEDTSMVQLQVKQEVMSAYTEIMDNKTQIPHNGQTQLPMRSQNGQLMDNGQQP
jgi:hypothetical protein